jgi:hypothetical protein
MTEWDSTLFDWSTWRAGNIWDMFKLQCHTAVLVKNGRILREYAVGWCPGERLMCRPKANNVAIMFYKDGVHFWFHLRKHEFEEIWNH